MTITLPGTVILVGNLSNDICVQYTKRGSKSQLFHHREHSSSLHAVTVSALCLALHGSVYNHKATLEISNVILIHLLIMCYTYTYKIIYKYMILQTFAS